MAAPRVRWLVAAVVPAALCYLALQHRRLVRHQLHRQAERAGARAALHRPQHRADAPGVRARPGRRSASSPPRRPSRPSTPANNQATLQNIRLWDWRALQDTLRQIQEIRTYYDFPDIDIDRYEIDGAMRQVMLATRELNVEKLPESSRNWINEKLIYTHGYGVTMNPVNGFTPEGLPTLILSNMPVQSTVPGLTVTRPEIYFGELTNTDVYVKTRQKEFNYPQGETNSLTSYEGNGGIVLGGFLRRLLIALDRGDLAKLPFSDDVNPESRLLMRRNMRDRVTALAPVPHLRSRPVHRGRRRRPAVVDDGCIHDVGQLSLLAALPSRRRTPINYMRNSVKVVIDAYDGTTTFYVFDTEDPIIAAYRGIFPSLFKDASAMPPALRKHVRYPELLLKLQAAVYGLYHMTDPEVFYNREDLWTVATEVGMNARGEQATQAMEPNFVLMKLPGETGVEFVEILPFTPAQPQQPDWLDRRPQRRRALRHVGRLRLSEDEAGRRAAADRGAHRSERAALRTAVAVESAGLARAPRHPAGDSLRARAAVRGADLSAGRAQPDAGAASRRARAAGSAGLRTDLRVGDGGAFRRSRFLDQRGGRLHRTCATRSRIRHHAPAGGRSQRAHRASRQRPRRLPAPDGGRQARRGGTEAGTVEAHARRIERTQTMTPSSGWALPSRPGTTLGMRAD